MSQVYLTIRDAYITKDTYLISFIFSLQLSQLPMEYDVDAIAQTRDGNELEVLVLTSKPEDSIESDYDILKNLLKDRLNFIIMSLPLLARYFQHEVEVIGIMHSSEYIISESLFLWGYY